MAFVNAQQTRVLWGAQALSSYLKSVSPKVSVAMLDSSVLSSTAHEFIAGIHEWSVNVDGLLDPTTTAGSLWADITTAVPAGTTTATTIGMAGFAAGAAVWLFPVKGANYDPKSEVNGLVTFSASFQAGSIEPAIGISLADIATMTTTTTGTAQNNSAASTAGATAQLHITAASGTTPTLDVTVQDSANGSTGWATIGTFTQAITTGAQQIAIAGTVRQYTRVVFTIAGTNPSFTAQASIGRH